jgi:hypothetical protein
MRQRTLERLGLSLGTLCRQLIKLQSLVAGLLMANEQQLANARPKADGKAAAGGERPTNCRGPERAAVRASSKRRNKRPLAPLGRC